VNSRFFSLGLVGVIRFGAAIIHLPRNVTCDATVKAVMQITGGRAGT
jgi:hypothetical protein